GPCPIRRSPERLPSGTFRYNRKPSHLSFQVYVQVLQALGRADFVESAPGLIARHPALLNQGTVHGRQVEFSGLRPARQSLALQHLQAIVDMLHGWCAMDL